MMASRGIEVIVHTAGEDVLAGRLWAHRGRYESASFSYEPEYLAGADAYELDPQLRLFEGQYQTAEGREMFGAFGDCAPDRWGKRLIRRNERNRASRSGTAERSFAEIDYLLGVRDDLRQGALRFRDPGSGTYLAEEDAGVPSLLDLPKLMNAADALERDEADEAELRDLLRGGSSLGGARPKAHVLDVDGRIAIAKFPSPANDEWDVMRWEAVALELARLAGMKVPDWHLETLDGKPVLIIDRFDRTAQGQRLGYVSAMTMLEATDHTQRSYLEIASVIQGSSPQADGDLEELWRRMVFLILISNTDDHLRNHGFLRRTTAGWSLAPAFDLNPEPGPEPKNLHTAIDLDNTEARLATALNADVLVEFRLNSNDAREILRDVVSATNEWPRVADKLGIARAGIEDMASAFEHSERRKAERLLGVALAR